MPHHNEPNEPNHGEVEGADELNGKTGQLIAQLMSRQGRAHSRWESDRRIGAATGRKRQASRHVIAERAMPVCAWVDGQYGISGVYLGVEAELGRKGVRRVVEIDLIRAEREALLKAAEAVRAKQADLQNLHQTTARHRRAAWLDETEQRQ